jgi:hypothetical protein
MLDIASHALKFGRNSNYRSSRVSFSRAGNSRELITEEVSKSVDVIATYDSDHSYDSDISIVGMDEKVWSS